MNDQGGKSENEKLFKKTVPLHCSRTGFHDIARRRCRMYYADFINNGSNFNDSGNYFCHTILISDGTNYNDNRNRVYDIDNCVNDNTTGNAFYNN